MRKKMMFALAIVLILIGFFGVRHMKRNKSEAVFNEYVAYFKSVYNIMETNYYQPVKIDAFNKYVEFFRNRIYLPQVKDKSKVDLTIKQIGTGIMVSQLKDPKDPFTTFVPTQIAKQFKQDTLSIAVGDVGIETQFKDKRLFVKFVEPRSDAIKKGINAGDEIVKIENMPVSNFDEKSLAKVFSPPIGGEVSLELVSSLNNKTYSVKLVSSQYIKQMLFIIPTTNKDIPCLQLKAFNQETGNDLRRIIGELNKKGISKLVIDLRDNAGGPPLAAWDISGIFLPEEQKLFYFQRRNAPPTGLVSPKSEVHYNGLLALLTNKGTGSAAELFAGLMQAYQRANVFGINSAGQVFLKSLFDLPDGAVLELTVAKGFLFNGNPIDSDGLKPNLTMPDDMNLINEVVNLMANADLPENVAKKSK